MTDRFKRAAALGAATVALTSGALFGAVGTASAAPSHHPGPDHGRHCRSAGATGPRHGSRAAMSTATGGRATSSASGTPATGLPPLVWVGPVPTGTGRSQVRSVPLKHLYQVLEDGQGLVEGGGRQAGVGPDCGPVQPVAKPAGRGAGREAEERRPGSGCRRPPAGSRSPTNRGNTRSWGSSSASSTATSSPMAGDRRAAWSSGEYTDSRDAQRFHAVSGAARSLSGSRSRTAAPTAPCGRERRSQRRPPRGGLSWPRLRRHLPRALEACVLRS
ncbi:hypothetical protein E4K10_00195 [Streptomyces sp. T1317-0309]|nr:hypothetical protein E4K10_00195 [Streptomyces sp. T1317-0309]